VIGQWFGNYRALSLLGEGGMGAVYLAEHPSIGRRVAIKVLRKELIRDTQHLGRFVNEARAANAIRHPNIVEILDSGTTPEATPYLVMELLEGEALSARLARERLPLGQTLEIARQTASALHAAHRQGIVHRDLKPDNLFLAVDTREARDQREPARERVKVLDFGIAKLQTTQPGDQVKTQTGIMMGTPAYMSPEQCLGTRHVGPRSDIYSLGVILYEMVCGAPPFWSEAWGALVNMHINEAPVPPGARVPGLPAAVEAIILRALAKNPDERWDTMAQLEQALVGAAGSPAGAVAAMTPALQATAVIAGGTPGPPRTPASPTTMSGSTGETGEQDMRPTPVARPSRAGRWLGAAALAAVVVGGVYFLRHSREGDRGAASGPAATAAAPAPEPAAATIQLGFETQPPGARVIRAADGVVLGTTPYRGSFPAGAGTLDLRLEREGYEVVTRAVLLARDRDEVITLTATPVKTPAGAATSKPGKPGKPRPRPGRQPDEPAKL
jgi:eukaryotic-like serine/threonine-protein kinase